MRSFIPGSVAMAIALACVPTVLMAQETTSSIRGSVTNGSGAAVAGATVTIVHTPSGTTSVSVTGAAGAFSAPGLRPGGPYQVSVAASGLPSASVEGIFLSVGEPLNVPVVLGGAENLEEVVISG